MADPSAASRPSVSGVPMSLVQVTTSDGIRLHGGYECAPESDRSPGPVDIWLCLHGTGSNFYAASTLAGLAPKLLASGAAVLRVNTRGHDLICTGPSSQGRWLQGAAFERIDQAPLDICAWLDWLRASGFARIGILGHSLGAVKAIYTQAMQDATPIAALVAGSPPRLSYDYFRASPRGEEFQQLFAHASQLVEQGRGEELMLVRFPLPYYVSAAGYVDRYGPADRYNVLNLLPRLSCPTLVTYGSSEVQQDVAFRGMPEAVGELAGARAHLQVGVIAGADHQYTACHDALAGRIGMWLRRI